MVTIAKWDTDNLGLKIGNLNVSEPVTRELLDRARYEAKAENYDLLYIKDVMIPEDLLSDKLILADTKITYAITVKDKLYACNNVKSISGFPITNELIELAYESGKYSRYKLDPNFPKGVFERLYEIWISKSLSGDIANEVLASQSHEKITGLLTYAKADNNYTIGLISVTPSCARHGVGSKLIQHFLSQLKVGSSVEVSTQAINTIACRFYEKNGFQIKHVTNIYHLWL